MHNSDDDYWWTCDYSITKCCGCGDITFLTETTEEGDIEYDENGNNYIPTKYKTYPFSPQKVAGLSDLWYVPNTISTVYRETIKAFNNDCHLLAATGFRMIIEAVCTENNIQGKTLEVKINNLCKNDIITKHDRDRLHSIRFMGNDSVHQMKVADINALLLVKEIIDIMLKNIYILAKKCSHILEGPITTFEDFCCLLDEGLRTRKIGDTDILKNLLPQDRRLIKEDRSNFEIILKEKIAEGKYTKLSLCPTPLQGKNQQYKVESI